MHRRSLRRTDKFLLLFPRIVARWAAICEDSGACETKAIGGKMKRNQKRPRNGGLYHYESAYAVELARGASHIASMLSVATQEVAVQEVIHAFVATHGCADFDVFCWLLAERLEQRGCTGGATHAREFDVSGMPRELAAEGCTG
jgi:hypothetical protein